MKPLELIGILVGLAGLGLGAYALLRRPEAPAPQPVPTQTVLPSTGRPVVPGSGTSGDQTVAVVGQVAAGAVAIAGVVGSLVDLFGSM